MPTSTDAAQDERIRIRSELAPVVKRMRAAADAFNTWEDSDPLALCRALWKAADEIEAATRLS